MRIALGVCLVLSLAFHVAIGPWSILPEGSIELHDVDGELSIPVDLLQSEPEPPPPPPPPPEPRATAAEPVAGAGLDASLPPKHDAGPRADAGPHDAALVEASDGAIDVGAVDGQSDAGHPEAEPGDGSSPASPAVEAGSGEAGEAGLVASGGAEDGGPGRGGPRDSVGMIGAAGGAQAGPQNVVLIVNMAVIRSHPVGARLGPLLSAIPQWDDFIGGSGVDPVRDTDWVLINGPSLMDTGRDAIIIHYSAPDAVVDKAIRVVSHKYEHGGAFDAGVPGVKAALGHADRYERVFLRPQAHLLAVVPRDYARTAAQLLRHAQVKEPRAGEAMRVTLYKPHNSIGIRGAGVEIPESISELRLWIVPRPDGGADVFGEGDTPDPASAEAAAQDMRKLVRPFRRNLLVALGTQGLLDGLEFSADGPTMRMHVLASREQIQALASLVAGHFGVDLQLPPLIDP